MKRRTAREKALQAMFQIDMGKITPNEALTNLLVSEDFEAHDENIKRKIDGFLESIVEGTFRHLDEIDALIQENLENWTIDRIGRIDRAILRIAVYEMRFMDEIPINVTINEAIELAKRFGDDQSGKFINGVLSKVKETLSK